MCDLRSAHSIVFQRNQQYGIWHMAYLCFVSRTSSGKKNKKKYIRNYRAYIDDRWRQHNPGDNTRVSVNYCFLAFRKKKRLLFFLPVFVSLLLFGNYIFHLKFQRRVRITHERVTFRNGNCAARCNRCPQKSPVFIWWNTKTNCAQQDYSSFALFPERIESNVVFFIWILNYKYGCFASHMFSWKWTTKRIRTYFELL